MQTECSAEPSVSGRVEGRAVVAEFDGGALTSGAGGLLLGGIKSEQLRSRQIILNGRRCDLQTH